MPLDTREQTSCQSCSCFESLGGGDGQEATILETNEAKRAQRVDVNGKGELDRAGPESCNTNK